MSFSFHVLTRPSFCGSQLVDGPHSVVFFPVHRTRARPLAVSECHPWPHPSAPAHCLAVYCRLLRLGFRSDSFLSFVSRSDAGGALSHGKCSAHDGGAPPRLCVLMLEDSTFLASVPAFTSCAARPGGVTGALAPADHPPTPSSSRRSN